MVSDDDRSVAADSWSVKSDYGSTMDDEQRHVEAAEVLSSCNYPNASDYSSDKEVVVDHEVDSSLLGLNSYWNDTYAEQLANFHEHGHAGDIWFGAEVMDVVVSWTKNLCTNMLQGKKQGDDNISRSESGNADINLSSWNVLDIGTGNGLLLQELAKQGFTNLTGTDYSEGAIELAQNLAVHNKFSSINFLVDDILETKLGKRFKLVMDKGTLDCIWLHPDGPGKRIIYWESLSNVVAPDGILIITSYDHTKNELLQEMQNIENQRKSSSSQEEADSLFHYLDHEETYSGVVIVAFLRK